MILLETLLYIIKNGKVLLIRKKRGLGAGYFNGVGGKVEDNEDVNNAAIRECIEEIGVKPRGLKWMGLLEFWNYDNNAIESIHFVHVFTASDYNGEPRESDEAEPLWFNINEIPFNSMWEDDSLWLPLILSGRRIYGRFIFNKWRMISHEVHSICT
ncbi:8-oxo-dGTP diphosphatase [Caldivirga maquilingensis]|uniref:Oxidized purine nucleoside triphosphate hydrolase n=1 Tax=Caldivirga maquilingensis (strain ATCC 700844 / DSM 13496 / JCM 10307 / IC-167) TaxID=397948 RepID=A8M9K1_CALMQ|nr:8-oxo-dGTP diphosphatase [Caldivirga maquilingensis]ABW00882.1 NUDIX hydrolase [Caldivirga maquilingensis IC-167]